MTDETITKICIKCNQAKPATEFGKRRASPDGLQFRCRECRKEQYQDYYGRNRDKELARAARNREENPEICAARIRNWQARNKLRVEANNKAWRAANPEKSSAFNKKWKDKNKEHLKAYKQAYVAANPDANRTWNSRRRARKLAAGGTHTAADIKWLHEKQKGKCACCSRSLNGGYHADHIMPLAKGGTNDRRNIQLLCPPCNQEKHAKDPIDFMRSRGFLL